MESINPDGSINWSNVNDWYGRPIPDQQGGGTWAYVRRIHNTGEHQIMANRMNAQGNLLWSDSGLVVAQNITPQSGISDIDILQDNSFILLYATNAGQSNFKSYIQIINNNGNFQFPDSGISISNSPTTVAGTEIIPGDSTNYIITWVDYDTSHFEFRCQKFNKNMERLWSQGDVIYSTRNHEDAAIIRDGRFGFIEIWDRFASPAGVFAQQVSRNGVLGEVITKINSYNNPAIPEKIKLFQNYPNPFNPVTTIKYRLPKSGKVRLEIFNILGQRVKTLLNARQNANYYTIQWNGTNNAGNQVSSGLYIYRLTVTDEKNKEKFVSVKKMLLVR